MTKISSWSILLLLASMLGVFPAYATGAASVFVSDVPGRIVDVAVQDRTGLSFPVIYSRGKHYVVGEMGQPYSILLTNHSPRRVLAVVSVDGVNVVTGQTATFDQAGYVILPYGQARVDGWRKSMSGVASFEFSPQVMSYASRTGRPHNVGVIGVAVFDEARRPRVFVPPAAPPSIASDRAPGAQEESAPQATRQASPALGTGHGSRIASQAYLADFRRASRFPIQLTRLEYDSRRNLESRGLWPVDRELQAFPGFVPDPWP